MMPVPSFHASLTSPPTPTLHPSHTFPRPRALPQVEPFSVKHKTDWSGGGSLPMLDTCNPGRVDFVTHEMWPQAVEEGAEVVFSYDVRFVVSDKQHGRRAEGWRAE
eukprot:106731-Chlamydomonas_euryale.AAC.2